MNAAIAKAAVKAATEGQFVTLAIDREVFAVPVESVLEILDMRQASRIPESPPYMLGLIDLRGRSIPVLDLRLKLGLPAVPPTETTRILVLEVTIAGRPLVLGLVADRVIEVMALSAGEIEAAPDIGVRWRSEYILGVGHRDGKFVIIFNLSRLFTEEDTEAFLTSVAA
jgi:purine-binding chemotaxis protein CheW